MYNYYNVYLRKNASKQVIELISKIKIFVHNYMYIIVLCLGTIYNGVRIQIRFDTRATTNIYENVFYYNNNDVNNKLIYTLYAQYSV